MELASHMYSHMLLEKGNAPRYLKTKYYMKHASSRFSCMRLVW